MQCTNRWLPFLLTSDPPASRSLAAFARYVGHPKVIIQGDSDHALMAVVHDACAMLTATTPRTSLVNSKGSNGAAERAVQSVEEMARTLRLDLLGRTNIAGDSDLPITSWMVRHAAWSLSHFQAVPADGKTAYARLFEKPYESPVLPFAELVMWKDPMLQPAKLRSSLVYGLWLGRDHRQATLTSLAREWASLWPARFDVCRRQNARTQVWWWP